MLQGSETDASSTEPRRFEFNASEMDPAKILKATATFGISCTVRTPELSC